MRSSTSSQADGELRYPWLSQQDFSRFVLDFLVFGNAFLEKRYSTTGKVIRLETSPAKYTRRGVEEDVYWWVPSFNEPTAFTPGSVFHLLEPDINQELYGLPEYLSALNSAWLNESATLFRRKHFDIVAILHGIGNVHDVSCMSAVFVILAAEQRG